MKIVKNKDGSVDIIYLVEMKTEDGGIVIVQDEKNKTTLKPGQLESEIEILKSEISSLDGLLKEKERLLKEISK